MQHFADGMGARGKKRHAEWKQRFEAYEKANPALAKEAWQMLEGKLPEGWDADIPKFEADPKGIATRDSSGKVLNAIAQRIPWLIGGSADLSPSTKTNLKFEGAGSFEHDSYDGRNLHFGIREHGMGAVCNGLALSGLRPYGSTFLIFSDYMKPPIRLSAIMEVPVVYVFTHDSIGVGEDGPTHQPIEQLASLRAMPNLMVLRPGDANEVTECWKIIAQLTHSPAALVLSRQNVPTLDRTKYAAASGVAKGGYIVADAEGGKPQVILLGTGSELSLCVDAYEKLKAEGIKARVVSLPCFEIFDQQDAAYKESVLPSDVTARVSVEMAATFGWERYTGSKGRNIGMHRFGASAPLKDLLKYFGFTVDKVVAEAHAAIGK
jgi:transketolase